MDDRLVRVFATTDTVAGEMMRGRLEAEGITAMLKGEGEGPYRAGPVYVWVSAEQERRHAGSWRPSSRGPTRLRTTSTSATSSLPTTRGADADAQRFEYCGALRAFFRPYLRRSFSRASRVRKPSAFI